MQKKNSSNSKELISDYIMFDSMSKDITKHYKKVLSIRKNIARNKKTSTDLKFEFLESLDIILDHMKKAAKELDRSKNVIKEL